MSGEAWPCGRYAAAVLVAEVEQGDVLCAGRVRDRYRRLVAVCWAGGVDLGRWLVAEGWALAYRRYALDYVPDEMMAQAHQRGLWAERFELPWVWRARRASR